MTGAERAEVREAILDAYDLRQLDRLLRDKFDLRREDIAQDGPRRDVVEDVLDHFLREGREAYLIAELAADRPAKPAIQEIYARYAAALLSEAWRSRIEAEATARLERYGLLPEAQIQRRGAKMVTRGPLEPAGAGAFSGFQRQIQARLPELDVHLWCSRLLQQTARVCRIEVDGTPRGTGFLVGPSAVLTCHHVVRDAIRDRASGQRLAFLFDYFQKPNGAESHGVRVAARGAWTDWHLDSSPPLLPAEEHAGEPAATGDQLDHALIALERPIGDEPIVPGGRPRGWIELPATAPTLTPGMAIAILHHPRTGPIKLTFDTDALQQVNPGRTRLRYSTNTDEGSSGSPCFDVSLGIIGLHHFSDPHSKKVPTYNQGIPIEAIRRRLAGAGQIGALGVSDEEGALGAASYDVFLAYAPADQASAATLYSLLQGQVRVFFDLRSLRPGDRRDQQIPAAQRAARATVVLISSATEADWYGGPEIARALELHQAAPPAHLLLPVLLDRQAAPPMLRPFQPVTVDAEGGLPGVAARLREVVARTR